MTRPVTPPPPPPNNGMVARTEENSIVGKPNHETTIKIKKSNFRLNARSLHAIPYRKLELHVGQNDIFWSF